jgi:hypothetical protein
MAKTKKITKARILKAAGKNPLLKHVAEWVIDRAADYDGDFRGPLKDLFYGGCESGMVGHLIYYGDTNEFGKKYQRQIFNLAMREAEECGEDNVLVHLGKCRGMKDVGTVDQLWNFLAWYGFETAARVLADRIGYDG